MLLLSSGFAPLAVFAAVRLDHLSPLPPHLPPAPASPLPLPPRHHPPPAAHRRRQHSAAAAAAAAPDGAVLSPPDAAVLQRADRGPSAK